MEQYLPPASRRQQSRNRRAATLPNEKPPPFSYAEDTEKVSYMENTFRNQSYPKNEYEHATWLLDSKMTKDVKGITHADIEDQYVQTSFIGNDELMAGLQMDLPFLHSMLSMAKRNKGLEAPFELIFYSWRGALLLSKAKEGMENLSQHATGARHQAQPFGAGGGYGSGLPQYQPEQQKKSFADQIRGIFGSKKQQQ